MYALPLQRPARWAGPFTLWGQVINLGLICDRNYCIGNPAFKSLKLLHMHYRNGWGAVFCITMKLLFIKLYFHAALNLLTALILLSSSRISDKSYLIQWKFETVSATDVPKFSLKSTDAPPFSQWDWVWRISWKKNSVSNLNRGIVYLNFCEYKNLNSRFSAVLATGSQACMLLAVNVNNLTSLRKYLPLCIW